MSVVAQDLVPLPYCSTFWGSHGCDKPYGHTFYGDLIHECKHECEHSDWFPSSYARAVPPGVNYFNEYGDREVVAEVSTGRDPFEWHVGYVLYTNHQGRVIL